MGALKNLALRKVCRTFVSAKPSEPKNTRIEGFGDERMGSI